MNIYIENKKCKEATIIKRHSGAIILDVTSSSPYLGAQILSPFYPHGNIPVPFSEGYTATCVEAIWQGLKVFEHVDVDVTMFKNDTMQNLKRTVRKYGSPKGHRKGVNGTELLDYIEARKQIYLPAYKYVLDNIQSVKNSITKIKEQLKKTDIVFLDYNTNSDVNNPKQPLSHASLIKAYIEGRYENLYLATSDNAGKEPTLL